MVSDRYIENYLAEKFPPKLMEDRFGNIRKAVWCNCSCSYELHEIVKYASNKEQPAIKKKQRTS